MKHIFIINPAAGSRDRTAQYCEKIHTACDGLDYKIHVSEGPGHCKALAHQAAESGEECRIYACGGDGTLNEVISGTAGFPNAAVTMFCGGSGNDFVKIFDDPKAFFSLERLLCAEETEFDLIRCNDRLSLNICSVGFDARISTDVANYKRLPLLSGFRAYALSTALNIIKGLTEHYVIEIDGEIIDGKKTLICACNGRFYGGGFNPVPDADPADGLLDILVVDKISRLGLVSFIGKYKKGEYAQLPQYVRHFRTGELTIHCDKEIPINLDGEVHMAKDVFISIAKEKLRFFYPKGLVWQAKAPLTIG